MTKVLALVTASHRYTTLRFIPISGMEVGFVMQGKRWPHAQVRRDAWAFYSLRQRLLCVIAPSPTRFTPYILSSSQLPHYRPPTPSLALFSLIPSHHFPSFPPYLHPSLLPSPPSDDGCSPALFTRLGQSLTHPCSNPQWQHVFPRCCWLSLCVR